MNSTTPPLSRTRTVLEPVFPGGRVYAQLPEDEGDDVREHLIVMDEETWDEMGRPAEITVTVEPGNTLG